MKVFIVSVPITIQIALVAMRNNGIYLNGILTFSPLAFFRLQLSILTHQVLNAKRAIRFYIQKSRFGVTKVFHILYHEEDEVVIMMVTS